MPHMFAAPWFKHFLASISFKISMAFLDRIQPIQSWNNLRKILQSHENFWSLTDLILANIGFHSNSRDWLFWVFMMSKINSLINEQKCVVLARCVNNFLYLYKELQKCNSRVWRYHCSTCIEYIYLYTRIV